MPKPSVFDPCYYCHATRLVKIGQFAPSGQRYRCRACGKSYNEATPQRVLADEQLRRVPQKSARLRSITRATGISTPRLKRLWADVPPEAVIERKYETLAEYRAWIHLHDLSPDERNDDAQWITARVAMQFLGLTRKSITALVQKGKLVGRRAYKHLWVFLPSVQAYCPLHVRRAERAQQAA